MIVSIIFDTCKHFKLNHYVRYLAVELFDRFYWKHILDCFQTIFCVEDDDDETIIRNWNASKLRLIKQLELRTVTCITLALKYYCSDIAESRVIGNKCTKFLDAVGYHVSLPIFRKSEIRVLQTIEYNISKPLPVSCIQVLLTVLNHNLPILKLASFYPTLYEVLDLFYFRRSTLRRTLERRRLQHISG